MRQLCTEFKIPREQSALVGEQLAALARADLLVSQDHLLDRLRQGPADEPVAITTIGIPTRDRAPSLARCLASVVDDLKRGPKAPDLVIVDDSVREEHRTANLHVARETQSRYPGRVLYAGPEAKERFARKLALRAGLSQEDVAFALGNIERCPITTGASRNLLLLQGVGAALLQLDDDTFGPLTPAPGARPGVVLTSQYDPTEFWFPAIGDRTPGAPEDAPGLLALHQQVLGRRLRACLDLAPDVGPDLDRAEASFYRRAAGRVRVTTVGVAGDSGMSSSLYLLLLEGESRARLLSSEAVYREGIRGGPLQRGATRTTIGHGNVCQALNLGLDHRDLLPPFMPVQRNQDGIFATLVRVCCDETYFGFLPWLIAHQSPQGRGSREEDLFRSATSLRSDQILQLFLRTAAPRWGGTVERNLRTVGAALAALGALPAPEFAEAVRMQVWEQMCGLSSQLAALLDKQGGEPAWWAADVRRLLDGLRKRVTEPHLAIPDDLRQSFGPDAALAVFQRLVVRFASLLQVWPDRVEAARDLRVSDARPAEPL